MNERLQVLGLYWDTGEPALHWRPALASAEESLLPLSAGRDISFRLHAPRTCIGYWHGPTGTRHRCPGQTVIPVGGRSGECPDCQQRGGGFYARTGFVGRPDEITERLRQEPHVAYLALFGSNVVKVGVAARRRKHSRVLEQGASAALFFGSGNGDVMRALEQDVVTRVGICEKVRLEAKVPLIWDQPECGVAETTLRQWFERVRETCSSCTSSIVEIPQFTYNVPLFQFDTSLATTNELIYVHEISPGDVVAGRLAGVMGALILLRSHDDVVYAVDGRALQGHIVEGCPASRPRFSLPPRHIIRPAVQTSLF